MVLNAFTFKFNRNKWNIYLLTHIVVPITIIIIDLLYYDVIQNYGRL